MASVENVVISVRREATIIFPDGSIAASVINGRDSLADYRVIAGDGEAAAFVDRVKSFKVVDDEDIAIMCTAGEMMLDSWHSGNDEAYTSAVDAQEGA